MDKDTWKKTPNEKPISKDKKNGYWIGSCPRNCRKVYREFYGCGFKDVSKVEKIFLYGYSDKNGIMQGDIISFYDNKQIAYKGFFKNDKIVDVGIAFDKKGNFEGFIDSNGDIVDREDGIKIIAKKRLKNL
jgi:antitoxin component YwqK of YwqJK toxin-antitoxin module